MTSKDRFLDRTRLQIHLCPPTECQLPLFLETSFPEPSLQALQWCHGRSASSPSPSFSVSPPRSPPALRDLEAARPRSVGAPAQVGTPSRASLLLSLHQETLSWCWSGLGSVRLSKSKAGATIPNRNGDLKKTIRRAGGRVTGCYPETP